MLGHGHAKSRHDVEDLAARGRFSLLRSQRPGAKLTADHGPVAHHRDLAQ
jgi:hypothetical protein